MRQQEIFGIDLGTTNSCIACVDENGHAVVIPNREGDQTTPSVVQFEGNDRIIGKEAMHNIFLYPDQVFQRVKQDMGSSEKRYRYAGVDYTPEEISSYILRKLADDAQLYLDRPVQDVVITCPAYFGVAQREATAKAGKLAGLTVHEVINEPTAAAILYGLSQQEDQVAIVYDLGGGTFDVTVIEIKNGAITVIATAGDNNLGGDQWDVDLMYYLDDQWMAQTGLTESPVGSEEYLPELKQKAEDAKKSLTARQKTLVTIAFAEQKVGIEVTRDVFQQKTAHLLQKTIDITKSAMNASREKGIQGFHQLLLVGGSTRMPQVKERLETELWIPIRIFDPDLAVARGAAIYGHKLMLGDEIKHRVAHYTGRPEEQVNIAETPRRIKEQIVQQIADETGQQASAIAKLSEMNVTNVASHSFGIVATDIKRDAQIISNLVIVNDPLPSVKTRTFRTAEEYQDDVEFQVMENSVHGARVEDSSLGEEIGHAVLHLPSGLPQYSPIEVTFELQHDGRLQIVGREPSSNTRIEVEIKTTRGISKREFQQALQRATDITIS